MNNKVNDLVKQVMDSPEMTEMRKAFIGTDSAPVSTQITYTKDLKDTVFEKAPFLRYLEAKGRTRDVNSSYVGFYKKISKGGASFINELDDIPETDITTYEEVTRKMSTIVKPIEVGLMAQSGNNILNFTANEQKDAFVQIANETDSTLLQGTGGQSGKPDFTGFVTDIKSNKKDLGGNSITEKDINEVLEMIKDGFNGNPDAIVTDYRVANQLNDIIRKERSWVNPTRDIGLGHTVTVFFGVDGTEIPILVDGNLKPDEAGNSFVGIIDSSSIDVAYLMRPTLLAKSSFT